jgi:hypothetical protein
MHIVKCTTYSYNGLKKNDLSQVVDTVNGRNQRLAIDPNTAREIYYTYHAIVREAMKACISVRLRGLLLLLF